MNINKKYYTIFNFLAIFMIFLTFNNIIDNIKDNISITFINISLSILILNIIFSLFCNIYSLSINNEKIIYDLVKREKFIKNNIIFERIKLFLYILFTLLNLILIIYNLTKGYTDRNLLLIFLNNILLLLSWYTSLEFDIFNKNKKIKVEKEEEIDLN